MVSIAILGTRGIPNLYGGFEQCAEFLSVGLAAKGYDVSVYVPNWHPYGDDHYEGVRLIRKWCPEASLGTAAHVVYDYLCLRDALRRKIQVALELGYGSSAPSYLLCDTKTIAIVTNMDGLEWSRDKWSPLIKRLMRWFEAVSSRRSHYLVADNPGIQEYLRQRYSRDSVYIPYGANVFDAPDRTFLDPYDVAPNGFFLSIARFEPENNLDLILDGYVSSEAPEPFLVIGNSDNGYGRKLRQRYEGRNVRFLGGIYNAAILDNLRHFSKLYFHGHSVGGTNPSLLEAMAAGARIRAHDNPFNRSVTEEGALYFQTGSDVSKLIVDAALEIDNGRELARQRANLEKIRRQFSWDAVVEGYARLIDTIEIDNQRGRARCVVA